VKQSTFWYHNHQSVIVRARSIGHCLWYVDRGMVFQTHPLKCWTLFLTTGYCQCSK